MSELNAYILGTDEEELDRLELQHRVWASGFGRGPARGGMGAM